MSFSTISLKDDHVEMIDQRILPNREEYLQFTDARQVADAIRSMVIRGAPAIGVAAAMGMAVEALAWKELSQEEFKSKMGAARETLAAARPTANNLFWALARIDKVMEKNSNLPVKQQVECLYKEAEIIHTQDIETNKTMACNGAQLVKKNQTILTHCNAGALATGGVYGTAVGVIKAAWEQGKNIKVIADETRPFLQGARLTAWEMQKEGIPVTVITDNMSGHFMKKGMIDIIFVGADRIAGNGDAANKIGTYMVAVLARENQIPFYVVAPFSTIDMSLDSGDQIPIEERPEKEVTHIGDHRITPEGVLVRNTAFDVTPFEYIKGIVTEKGVVYPPFDQNLKLLANQ